MNGIAIGCARYWEARFDGHVNGGRISMMMIAILNLLVPFLVIDPPTAVCGTSDDDTTVPHTPRCSPDLGLMVDTLREKM